MMLEVTDLVSGYGKSEVLRGINLKITHGQIVTIIGPNGAGKTTLFRTILGLLPARKGTVLFENEDLSKLPPLARIQRGIALVPQGRAVFPDLSVLENMEMGAYTINNKTQIQETMEECYHLFPVLRERKKQRAGTLSGGEQQMLVIARALMSKPRFVMLDEPSLGISPRLVKEIFKTIDVINTATKTTICLVEQNANIALKHGHFGYVMEGGQIRMSGSTQELLNDERVKHAYLGKRESA
jgi:branched-chain amino acid transport system ATP-binding protein